MGVVCGRCCQCYEILPAAAMSESRLNATNHVKLAATEIFKITRFITAYHTSVLLNDEEFFFTDRGIIRDFRLASHHGSPSEILELGFTCRSGDEFFAVLSPQFPPGTYDHVLKNCNTFSDVGLYYLLGRRLHRRYSALERVGQVAGTEIIQKFVLSSYEPNKMSQGYTVDDSIAIIDRMFAQEHKARGKEIIAVDSSAMRLQHLQANDVACTSSRVYAQISVAPETGTSLEADLDSSLESCFTPQAIAA